jgi:hypothetical protein
MIVSYNKVQLKSVLWFHLHLYPVFSLCFFWDKIGGIRRKSAELDDSIKVVGA